MERKRPKIKQSQTRRDNTPYNNQMHTNQVELEKSPLKTDRQIMKKFTDID